MTARCHVCDEAELALVSDYASLRRVTSDGRTWRSGGQLGTCPRCGTAQKAVDEAWREDVAEIYSRYEMYERTDGQEQSVFDAEGFGQPRSRRILDAVAEHVGLPDEGRLLDVGCGNGVLLRAFAGLRPRWTMVGTEIGDRQRAAVEAIPGVEHLHVGEPDDAAGAFDLVVLSHVLEHVPGPRDLLRRLATKLAPGGLLVLEVPDLEENPFDVVVADHCTHFALDTLRDAVVTSGLQPIVATRDWIRKELTVVAAATGSPAPAPPTATGRGDERATGWLARLRDDARSRSVDGIFGTSTSSTWLFAELDGAPAFFVDEDPTRRQRPFLGRPVLDPSDVASDASVYVPLPLVQAEPIVTRLAGAARYHAPPAG